MNKNKQPRKPTSYQIKKRPGLWINTNDTCFLNTAYILYPNGDAEFFEEFSNRWFLCSTSDTFHAEIMKFFDSREFEFVGWLK